MFVKGLSLIFLHYNGVIGFNAQVNDVESNPIVSESTLAPTQTKITQSEADNLSPTSAVRNEEIEITSSPTYIEKFEELSTLSPTLKATTVERSSEYFNYDPYSKFSHDR